VKDYSIYYSYNVTRNALLRFAAKQHVTMMNQIDPTFLDGLVSDQWGHCTPATRHHHIQIVQDFFEVSHSRAWIGENPSTQLVRPKRTSMKATLPFNLDSEDPKIVAAIPCWHEGIQRPEHSGLSIWAPVSANSCRPAVCPPVHWSSHF
jgi:hypothetical protein